MTGKKNKPSFFHSKKAIYILLAVFLFFCFNFARAYYQNYKVKKEISMLEQEVKELETKKLESLEILKYVSGNQYVEETARTELQMKKPGEKVLILNADQYMNQVEEEKQTTLLTNPKKWIYYFITHEVPKNT